MNRLVGQFLVTLAKASSLVVALLLASPTVFAAGSGTIAIHGKTTQMKDAYAYRHPAPYDPAETMTTIVVCDKAIDAKKLTAGGDRDKAVHAWLEETKAVYWEAILYADGSLWTTNVILPGVLTVNGGGGGHNLRITLSDGKRIEGAYLDPDEKDQENFDASTDLTSFPSLDVKFAVDVQ